MSCQGAGNNLGIPGSSIGTTPVATQRSPINCCVGLHPVMPSPAFKGNYDLLERLKELLWGRHGSDTGFGAGGCDVRYLWCNEYYIYGIDAVKENMQLAKELYPEISDLVNLSDPRYPLDFPEGSFDFVICNSVTQHIAPEPVYEVTLPALARALKRSSVLQLMLKNGNGILSVYDRDYGAECSFQL